jgi:predicted MFS family arabinose efflux permease
VPNPYPALLRVPGGPAFSAAAFVARLPIAMLGIAIVLLVSSTTHQYSLAGAVSATFALAGAVAQPRLSRVVDRQGQARALPPQVAVATAGVVALVWLAGAHAPAWTLFPAAVVGGAAYPNVGSLVRARWSKALSGRPELRTAYSLESILDEVIFVLGPPFVTLLAARVGAAPALLTAVCLTVVGSALLLVQRSTEPEPTGAATTSGPSAIAQPGVRLVTLLLTALGGVFGSVEVVTVAFAGQRGEPAIAGLLLSLYAAGSLCAGVVFGARPPRLPLDRQLLVLGAAVPFTVLAFPFAGSAPLLGALSFAAGLLVSPTLITAFQLVETLVPAEQLTEGLSWATTGIVFGVSISAAAAGRLVDLMGTPHAYVVTTASGVATGLIALAGARRLHRALQGATARSQLEG